jgi:hypothetical protein
MFKFTLAPNCFQCQNDHLLWIILIFLRFIGAFIFPQTFRSADFWECSLNSAHFSNFTFFHLHLKGTISTDLFAQKRIT